MRLTGRPVCVSGNAVREYGTHMHKSGKGRNSMEATHCRGAHARPGYLHGRRFAACTHHGREAGAARPKPVNEVRGLSAIHARVRDDVVVCCSGHRGRRGFHRRRTHEGLARQLAEHTPIVVGETRQIP